MYRRIRNLREDKDLTQQQVADFLHVAQATYSRYESGDLDMPSAILIKLSYFHKVSIDYLLELTDSSILSDQKCKKCAYNPYRNNRTNFL